MTNTCSIIYVHHCYEGDDKLASVWCMPGIEDPDADESPFPEEYSLAVLVVDKKSGADAMNVAQKLKLLFSNMGISGAFSVTADD